MLFLVFQRLRDTAEPRYQLTVGDWQGFLNALFDNWNSRFDPPANPELPTRLRKQTQLEVGTLKQDHPPSIARQRSGDLGVGDMRKKAEKVSLGLSLNYETGSVLWTWSDSNKQGVSHQYVTLDPGNTEVSIRQDLIRQYDFWERQRIKQYNKDLLVSCCRRIIKRWVHEGTERIGLLNRDEEPQLETLVLACDIVRSDAARLTEVSRLVDSLALGNGSVW
ncbi:uncharacterized protein FOBCDRAFT_223540 [Fusarium oxysporum Fo47]|uniref:Uncharacterized protein n=1 Tax=Fusarium oxysporum Fo47 TaxID=660027 RepID=W9K801_FUSOX|nr:uncharacterized protein FOBCDRAFT_223540 [Fusarium oxysporum Fo47]EWZ37538.1 hypothetical protein FOZG_09527 [Fusarium oxysporum Fo47]QKD54526.2 hypothetical protein FOBCDRAFT_223540 [Fusarium oxysporum Fo47]